MCMFGTTAPPIITNSSTTPVITPIPIPTVNCDTRSVLFNGICIPCPPPTYKST